MDLKKWRKNKPKITYRVVWIKFWVDLRLDMILLRLRLGTVQQSTTVTIMIAAKVYNILISW